MKLLIIGRKGRDALRRDHGRLIVDTLENVTRNGAQFEPARDLSRRLRKMFDAGDFDVCTLLFNTFKSAISQVVTAKQIIPFPTELREGALPRPRRRAPSTRWSRMTTRCSQALLPANLSMQIFRSLLESYASEQGARMTAMDNATRNAGDMIDRLTLTYNRSRQAAITKELIEIISGAEAV